MNERYTILRVNPGRPDARPRAPAFEGGGEPPPMRVDEDELSKRQARSLAQEPGVTVVPVMPIKLLRPEPAGAQAPPATRDSWGVHAVRAVESPFDGSGVVVALLDTGIDAAHPAFAGVELARQNFSGGSEGDVDGHGTHCAGTFFGRDVHGARIGVARGVRRALVAKVLDDRGEGDTTAIFKGLVWAVGEGARVVSMSIGLDFPGQVSLLVGQGLPYDIASSRALVSFTANLRAFDGLIATLARPDAGFGRGRGCVIVGAAGNESRRQVDPSHEVGAALPGSARDAVSVGALGRSPEGLTVPPYSNTLALFSAPGEQITSAAPGGGLASMNGTSMAAPHVAGVAALWWQRCLAASDGADALDVVAQLRATVRTDVFAPGVDEVDRGRGLVTAPA